MHSTWHRCLPTDTWVRYALVPVLVFIAMASDQSYLADFWHHLARGRAMAEEGRLVDHDLFTFTVPGQPFQDVNWLSQLCYYGLYQWGGLALVQVANALVLALALGLLVHGCHRRVGSSSLAMGLGIIAFLGMWEVLTVRPQTFSLLFFVVEYALLERAVAALARGERLNAWLRLGCVPVIVALWANMHGAFPAGLILVGGFLAGRVWEARTNLRHDAALRMLAVCLLVSTLATLVNPYGWDIYRYVGLTSNTAAARGIDEWLPPALDSWIGRGFFVSLAALTLIGWFALRRGYRPRAQDLLSLGCFLVLASRSIRMVPWWLLLAVPVTGEMLRFLFKEKLGTADAPKPTQAAAWTFAALMLAALSSLPGLQRFNPLLAARAQSRLEHDLDVVRQHLLRYQASGRIFSRFEWGEYLTWTYTPQFRVFMDGRIEIYPDAVWQAYADVTQGHANWVEILDRYEVSALVLDEAYHARTGLLSQVERCGRWRRVAQSRSALLYVRQDGPVLSSAAP